MSPLLACPVCSSARAHQFRRPLCIHGKRSGRYFIVSDGPCDHISTAEAWNSGDDPEPLIATWNSRATALAAECSAARGHTPEQASDFLAAHWPKTYRQHGVHT